MLKVHGRRGLLAGSMLAGLCTFAMAAPATAQEVDDGVAEVEQIVVTGSRIRQRNLETTSPITQVTGEDIDVAGVTRVEDLVTQLPQAFAAQNSTSANGANGNATVSLRNMGANRTLVLIDGRRMGYGSPNDVAADLNQIPEQLIERVEVLTGGASAIYGSDAISGVVNFITKKDFRGLQIDAQYGFYQHNNDYDGPGNVRRALLDSAKRNPAEYVMPDDNVSDGESRSINIIMGTGSDDGRANLMAYAGYRRNNEIVAGQRDFGACALGLDAETDPYNFYCSGSGTSYPGQFRNLLNGDTLTIGGSAGNGTFVPYDKTTGVYNYGANVHFQRPDERYILGAMGSYKINDRAEAYAQLMFSDYKSVAQIAPAGAFMGPIINMKCDNPLLSAQQRTTLGCGGAVTEVEMMIGRRNVEGGPRQDSIHYNSFRMVTGVRGALTDSWNYDVTGQFSRVGLDRVYNNDFSKERLARAFDVVDVNGVATCRSVVDGTDKNCVPYNIFSPGGVTPEALKYLQIPLLQSGYTTQQMVTAVASGDLGVKMPWSDLTAQAALGVEYRRDALDSHADAAFEANDGAGQGGPTIGYSGSADVMEIFGELQLPLAENKSWVYSSSLDMAYRYSKYDNYSADTYKIGLDYAPTEDVRFRASFSKAVRAPNVIELYQGHGYNLSYAKFDPCSTVGRGGAVPASCIGTNPWQVTAAQAADPLLYNPSDQYSFKQGGNTNLTPEEAETFTFGAVFTPRFLPGFNLSLDYYDIKVENLIGNLGIQNIFDACYVANMTQMCERIKRDARTGSLWLNEGHVEDTSVNIGGQRTSGIDLNANYSVDLSDWGATDMGRLAFGMSGTWLQSLETDTGLGFSNSVYDCAGYYGSVCVLPNPEWRHRARVTWMTPWNVDLTATWRHIGSVTQAHLAPDGSLGGAPASAEYELSDRNYIDLAVTWQARHNLKVRAGINNVFDIDPPLTQDAGSQSLGSNNTYPQVYDSLGRFMFVGLTADF